MNSIRLVSTAAAAALSLVIITAPTAFAANKATAKAAASAKNTDPNAVTKDPVCGMNIKASEAKATREYKGATYKLCSDDCKTRFDKDPGKYAVKPAKK